MMKKLLTLPLLLLSISACFAFSIELIPADNSVKPGGIIHYNISMTNDLSYEKTVVLYMLSDKLTQHVFLPSYQVKIPANTKTVVQLSAVVPVDSSAGRYYDSIYFEIDSVVYTSQTISYTVEGPEKHFDFKSISVPAVVDPRYPFNVTLHFENNYYEKVQKVYASVAIYKEDGDSLYYDLKVLDTPEGNNTADIEVNLNPSLLPTTANVRVNITWYDLSFGSKVEQFSIIGYTRNTTDIVKSTNIVSSTNGVVIENNGTLVIEGFDYELSVSSVDAFFISGATVDYSLVNNTIVFHVPELAPGESVTLAYELNYSVLYLLPFLVLGVVYLIYYFTRTVSVKKEIFEFKNYHNAVNFKVVINVSNVSRNKISRVRVKEFLPLIISEVYDYGTLKGELKKDKKSRKFIEWDIGKLKPGENVILSYRMRSKVGFIGELKLKKGLVEVLDAEGETKTTITTNKIIIGVRPKTTKDEETREEHKKK